MKRILAILSVILTMFISSETLARPHGGHGGWHGGGYHYVHHGHHRHDNGWLLPLGIVLGSALTYGATRETYVQQPVYQPQPVYYQQPVYRYQGSPVIIRDTNCYRCY